MRTHWLIEKQKELARCFDRGRYYEVFCGLELAVMEQDADTVLSIIEEMLSGVGQIADFRHASLYAHMHFSEPREEFLAEIKENLLKCFHDEETFQFLKDNERWKKLAEQQKQTVHRQRK